MDENKKTDFQEAMRQIRNVILTRDANTDFKYSVSWKSKFQFQ